MTFVVREKSGGRRISSQVNDKFTDGSIDSFARFLVIVIFAKRGSFFQRSWLSEGLNVVDMVGGLALGIAENLGLGRGVGNRMHH